ncbi:WbuC family cupin fold metalloprotein [Bacteroides sp. KG123]|uniref:WbuC family cupin fold metalloprotein n=1 Tax=unclassified Bacteroides TaxID=2646097 RepID=UPI003D7F46AC
MNKLFDKDFLDSLLAQAAESPRLRQNYDLRNSSEDTSQRMLNALLPGVEVAIHRHENTAETVVCLRGKLEEIFYEEIEEYTSDMLSHVVEVVRKRTFREVSRQLICPSEGLYGMQIPAGTWHTVNVLEPSIIFEAKDGSYIP